MRPIYLQMADFNSDILHCLQELKEGRAVCIHTEAGWVLASDARKPTPFPKGSGRPVLLLAEPPDLFTYLSAPPLNIQDELQSFTMPTAITVSGVLGVDDSWLNDNLSIAVTLARDEFSFHLVKRFRHPLVLMAVADWNGFKATRYNEPLATGFQFIG